MLVQPFLPQLCSSVVQLNFALHIDMGYVCYNSNPIMCTDWLAELHPQLNYAHIDVAELHPSGEQIYFLTEVEGWKFEWSGLWKTYIVLASPGE